MADDRAEPSVRQATLGAVRPRESCGTSGRSRRTRAGAIRVFTWLVRRGWSLRRSACTAPNAAPPKRTPPAGRTSSGSSWRTCPPTSRATARQTIRTPNVDRLAAEGVKFERAFVTGPICSISRSALITGMYQTSIGAQHHRSGRGEVEDPPAAGRHAGAEAVQGRRLPHVQRQHRRLHASTAATSRSPRPTTTSSGTSRCTTRPTGPRARAASRSSRRCSCTAASSAARATATAGPRASSGRSAAARRPAP